jgi:putative ATP-dependent endonuclease of OLD family
MGPSDGYLSTLARQGSGARRTLLWTALKYISEQGKNSSERPHVLLLDEPEICLHPSAIREARKVLYELPNTGNWQVMVTTHSPVFIDLSYDNTTIVRVDREGDNKVKSTTLYRPKTVNLSSNDKENLKLLNVCDTYLHEFFFGGRIIIVEGDTEFTAFSFLKMLHPTEYGDIQIIRARGKGIIPSVIKILNQFTCDFAVLHDTDTQKLDEGKINPAWSLNQSIKDEITKNPNKGNIRLIACKTNFEDALFGQVVKYDKPYSAILKIRSDDTLKTTVKQLLDSLLAINISPPQNCIRWNNIEQLK